MKIRFGSLGLGAKRKVIARFGAAKLMKTPDSGHELVGGSDEDQAEAREWASLFCHEAVIRRVTASGSARKCPCPLNSKREEAALCG